MSREQVSVGEHVSVIDGNVKMIQEKPFCLWVGMIHWICSFADVLGINKTEIGRE